MEFNVRSYNKDGELITDDYIVESSELRDFLTALYNKHNTNTDNSNEEGA